MVVGLEDDEFWDGIPNRIRRELPDKTPDEQQDIREAYEIHGWNGYPVRAYQTRDGRTLYQPTAENLSQALRIIMRLLARKGILWKKKRRTRFAPFGDILDEDHP